MQLAILHPAVAFRSCDDCQKWKYDEETGEIEMFGKMPMKRTPEQAKLVPCRTKAGCPKGTPEHPRSLTAQNAMAWRYLRECRAVNQWPDDAIVRRNAAIVEWAERLAFDAKAERRNRELAEYVKAAIRLGAVR